MSNLAYEEGYRSGVNDARADFKRDTAVLRAHNTQLMEALSELLMEVHAAGFSSAKDFGWPRVILNARAALKSPEPTP